jgi:hypothetical protein
MEGRMARRGRRGWRQASLEVLLGLLLLLGPLAARPETAPEPAPPAAEQASPGEAARAVVAEDPEAGPLPAEDAQDEEAAGSPTENPPGEAEPEPPRVPYESVDPGDRRGRTFDPAELRTDTREPSFGSHTEELGDHRGDSRELRELSRPPGPLPPEEEEKVPAPLRIRRPPGDTALRAAPLGVRLCDAERELEHARRERVDAVADYKRARRAEYPRGDAKALVVQRRELTGRRLERAEAALDALLGEAAEQGVEFDPAECPTG